MARRLTSDEVSTAAKLAGVPPALALAIWQQESSSGANTKTSPKGAMGGFQVMPDTFRRYMPGGNMHDPVDNMHAGLAVLADGLRQARGDWEGAAQFYYHGKLLRPGIEGPNSGPGTPSTRQYGRQVVAKAGGQQNDFGMPDMQMAEASSGFDASDLEFGGMDEEMQIPGFTPAQPNMLSFNQFDPQMNAMGSRNYEMDRYIRRLVDDEFNNGRPVRA